MAAYINTNRWKYVLEKKLLETYINACFFEGMHNTTVYEKVTQEHTWIPHHDTTLSIYVRHHEAASLALNTILWHED